MRQDRHTTMPVQSDKVRRTSAEPATPRIMSSSSHDSYYMRRMKEILHVKTLPPTSGVTLHGKSSNANSIPPVGTLVNVGPPSYPVRLLDHVYMGSQRNADDIELLKRCGITHVLNCAGLRRYDFSRSPYPKEAGIKGFLMISAEDHEDFDIKSHFNDAIAFLDDVKKSRGRALVHCNLGVNRSGAVVAAYLMASERRTLLDVIQYLKSKRFVVLSNKGFRRQLIRFARERGLLDPVDESLDKTMTDDGQAFSGRVDSAAPCSRMESSSSRSSSANRSMSGGNVRSAPTLVIDGCRPEMTSKPETVSASMSRLAVSDMSSSSAIVGDQVASASLRSFLSPVYESAPTSVTGDVTASGGDCPSAAMSNSISSLTSSSSSSRPSNVLGGFLTLLGSRKPFRSTSFSNMSTSCSGSTTSVGGGSQQGSAPSASPTGSLPTTPGGSLSTSRPLRVYTRSSTDTELYRQARDGTRPSSAATRHHYT